MAKFEIVSKYTDILSSDFIPKRATEDSAGYDLCAAEDIIIPPIWSTFDRMSWALGRPIEVEDVDLPLGLEEVESKIKEFGLRPTLISTGLKVKLNKNEFLGLYSRSSAPYKYLVTMANSVGIIDRDYHNNPNNEGEIFVQVLNFSPFAIQIKKGDKIAQGIIQKFGTIENEDTKNFKPRNGGLGSTTLD
ncbi:MAG: dUTP diphosphatase [Bacilli bacterium]|uniref:hypothetical protein n=1 Tax=Clostridium sp. TaxID=1506 RepID=UPI002FC6E4A5